MKEVKTGMMVFLALVLFMVTVLTLGHLGDRVSYIIPFPQVVGLTVDSPVQLNGVQVGRVDKIAFPEDVQDDRIFVRITLDASVRNRINASTMADISSLGVLGDKYISLETTDYSLPPLPEEGTIQVKPALDVGAMLEQGSSILTDLAELTHSINRLVETAESGEGLVGTLIKDPQLGQDLLTSLSVVSTNLSEGTGILGKLINDKDFCTGITDRVTQISSDLSILLEAMRNGDGVAGQLIMDPAFADRFRTDTLAALNGLHVLGDKLAETTDGSMLVTLLADDQAGEDLKAALGHLRSILEKIDRGEGSLGLLVNDATLYNEATTVLTGAKESWVTRKVVKHYRNLSEEAAEEKGPSTDSQ